MKILHVYKAYLPEDFTGVPRTIFNIAESLADRDVESHVLALFADARNSPETIGHHTVHKATRNLHLASTSLSISAFGMFAELAEAADVIHYHFPWPMADLLYFAHGRKRPSVITYHSDIVKQRRLLTIYSPLMHRFLSAADAIVATSENYARTSKVLGRYREKLSVVPLGIEERPPASNVAVWQARLGRDFFLFVGAMRYYKGLDILLEAARMTGLPVVLAGNDAGNAIDATHLPPNVTKLGAISEGDKEALLELCGAFVLPSHMRSEAFGVALVEAARAARPMISCEIGTGTSYVNLNGETGFVVTPGDAQALSAAMQALATKPELRAAMGLKARQRYESLFRAAPMGAAYLDIYRSVAR